jgi:hypothetical protein
MFVVLMLKQLTELLKISIAFGTLVWILRNVIILIVPRISKEWELRYVSMHCTLLYSEIVNLLSSFGLTRTS